MGTGLGLLALAGSKLSVFVFVGILALGLSFISPNLAALISKRGGRDVSVKRSEPRTPLRA